MKRARSRTKIGYCISTALVVLACVASNCGVLHAQNARRGRSFEPARPTISPWLGLLQSNGGTVPNYFSMVRPQFDQQSTNQQFRTATRNQAVQIQALASGSASSQSLAPQTGTGAGFMQFLHYFPQPTPFNARRR